MRPDDHAHLPTFEEDMPGRRPVADAPRARTGPGVSAPLTRDGLVLALMEALEEAGIAVTVKQGSALADALTERFPAVRQATKQRRVWTGWTEEQYAEVRTMYERGDPVSEICRVTARSPGQINGAVTRLNLRRGSGTRTRRTH